MVEHVTLVLGVLIVYLVASMWGIFIGECIYDHCISDS